MYSSISLIYIKFQLRSVKPNFYLELGGLNGIVGSEQSIEKKFFMPMYNTNSLHLGKRMWLG